MKLLSRRECVTKSARRRNSAPGSSLKLDAWGDQSSSGALLGSTAVARMMLRLLKCWEEEIWGLNDGAGRLDEAGGGSP